MVKFFKRYLTLLIIIPIHIGAVMNSDIQISNYKFIGEQIVNTATKYIGVKYRYGHSSPNGFDCSGLTQYVYNKHAYLLILIFSQLVILLKSYLRSYQLWINLFQLNI